MSAVLDPGRAQLRRNAVTNVVARGASSLIWVLITPFVLGRLGVERFGIWSIFFVVTAQVGALDVGLGSGLPRFLAAHIARGDREAARVLVLRSAGIGVILGLLWAATCLATRGLFMSAFHVPSNLESEVARSLLGFAPALFAFALAQVVQGALTGFHRIDLANGTLLGGLVAQLAVLVPGLALGGGLETAAAAMGIGYAVQTISGSILVHRELGRMNRGEQGEGTSIRELLRFGAVVQGTNALIAAQLGLGKLLLGWLGRLMWVAQFELGFRVGYGLWSVPMLIQAASLPSAAMAFAAGDSHRVRDLYLWTSRWSLSVAALLLGGLWAFAPLLMRAWLPGSHPEAATAARVLAAAFACGATAGTASVFCRASGRPSLETAYFAVALAINVAGCLVLTRSLGSLGVALSSLLSFAVAGAWFVTRFHRSIDMPIWPWVRKVVAPRLGAAAVLAALVAPFADRIPAQGRMADVAALAACGLAWTCAVVAILWPTGDPSAAWARARTALAGAAR